MFAITPEHGKYTYIGSDTYNNKSSAYRDTLWVNPHLWSPHIPGFDINAVQRESIIKANNNGLIGDPWHVPLVEEKHEWFLLVTADALGFKDKSSIHDVKLGPKPNLLKHSNEKLQSTISNAFSASKEMITSALTVEAGEYETFKRLRTLENECCPIIKPVWSGEINSGITFSNWQASALANILISQ